MANDVGNGIDHIISIQSKLIDSLYKLRAWSHLSIAFEDSLIWIRGFTASEIVSARVLSLPSVNRYYLKNTKLIPYGQKLPAQVEPSLLWTPIDRGLKINLPSKNFNYFGLDESHDVSIVPSDKALPINVAIVNMKVLANYLFDASQIRVQNMTWTLLDDNNALILGTPVLPIDSDDFYQLGCFILPAGWKIKFDNMLELYESTIADSAAFFYLINSENIISKLRRSDFTPLSKGSVLKTLASLQDSIDLSKLA